MGKQTPHILPILLWGAALITLITALCMPVSAAYAQNSASPFKSTPYPIPRFVTLDSGEVYVRTGPGQRFPIRWILKRKGMPVEIILEYEHWRKIRDVDGQEGWVHQSLLSGRRSGIVKAQDNVSLRARSNDDSRLMALIQPNFVLSVHQCLGAWCRVTAAGYSGWIERKFIWGVYENEDFD